MEYAFFCVHALGDQAPRFCLSGDPLLIPASRVNAHLRSLDSHTHPCPRKFPILRRGIETPGLAASSNLTAAVIALRVKRANPNGNGIARGPMARFISRRVKGRREPRKLSRRR